MKGTIMKKFFVPLLCALAVLTLTACGNKTTSPTSKQTYSSSDEAVYKQPTANGGTGAAITDNTPNTTSSAAANTSTPSTTSDTSSLYETEEENGGIIITKYLGTGDKVSIPSKIAKKDVIGIADHAFRGVDMKTLIIPGSVREIGTHSFSGCSNLENLTLGDGVKTINGYAFADCPNLALVTLPDSVREINSGAFNSCPNLKLTYKGDTYTAVNIEDLYDFF